MNNIPKNTSTSPVTPDQRSENANSVTNRPAAAATGNRQASAITLAASEIGANAARQRVRFSPTNNNQIQEQIRTYVPGERTTPQRIAEGDREGAVLANGRSRSVMRELISTTSRARPTIVSTRQSKAPPAEARWKSNPAPARSRPTVDKTMSMPTRRADPDNEI